LILRKVETCLGSSRGREVRDFNRLLAGIGFKKLFKGKGALIWKEPNRHGKRANEHLDGDPYFHFLMGLYMYQREGRPRERRLMEVKVGHVELEFDFYKAKRRWDFFS